MIVYYKKLANLLMVAGAALGAMLGLIHYRGNILSNESKVAIFVFALFIFSGIIVFRFIAAIVCSNKLKAIQSRLYVDADPKGFLEEFEAVNAKVPKNLAEYANGQNWISYAKEALGDYEGAWNAIKDLKPNELKIHALTTSALIVNQKANLRILMRDLEAAGDQIDDLRHLKELAQNRARMLYSNLEQQIRVQENRIAAARGKEDTDIKYLEEEIQFASNPIYKKEMQVEAAEFYLRRSGEDKEHFEKAMKLLKEVVEDRKGLYTEKRADELMKNPEEVYVFTEETDTSAEHTSGDETTAGADVASAASEEHS